MATQSKPTDTNQRRNWAENEALIAEGILSLLRSGRRIEQIRAADVSRETGIDPDVVQKHLLPGDFYSRNIHRIAEDFVNRPGRAFKTDAFASVFLSSVTTHKVWFEIELYRQSYQLFREIFKNIKSALIVNWTNQPNDKIEVFYRLFCGEVYVQLHNWIASGFAESTRPEIENRLTQTVSAFATGQPNTILTAILY